jgi:glycosyltransferase involved in cell wall biosynthesis
VDPERLILLSPIEPAPSGNGLAMRAELFRRAAPHGLDVLTVVIPVAGRVNPEAAGPQDATIVPTNPVVARAGVTRMIGERVWRERLDLVTPLPAPARAASPGLGDAVVQACRGERPVAVHVMRSYLAPLGIAVAERLEAAWVTLDLDEDDAALAAALDNPASAADYDRLLAVFGALFDGICAASVPEAEAISNRHRITVEYVPNAVDPPTPRERTSRSGGAEQVSLLFVGNLTYVPNADAARVLVEEILPCVQRRLGRPVRVTLVGSYRPWLGRLERPGVELAGFASDLSPVYEAADVVVVPLAAGAGTRIKLLEAFAHRVPVVCSGVAAEGLEVTHARHLLLADSPDETAAAIETILVEPALAARLTEEAERLVTARYSTDVVIPEIREFFARAAVRARGRPQLSGAR